MESMSQPVVLEKHVALVELEPVLALLREKGYLDTSFEGKEVHELAMRALSKEEALDEYDRTNNKPYINPDLEKYMPYKTTETENLVVMMMSLNKNTNCDEVLAEMDKLGVRPLTYEELIQYGIAHPSHQEQNEIIGLGSRYSLGDSLQGGVRVPVLFKNVAGNSLRADRLDYGFTKESRFPVVRK